MKLTVQIVNPENEEIVIEETMELAVERIPLVIRVIMDEVSEETLTLMNTNDTEFMKRLVTGLTKFMVDAFLNESTIGLEVKMSDIFGD